MSQLDSMNLDSLLDTTLDDLEDLPEFKPFQPGAHRANCTFTHKTVNDNECVEIGFKLLQTLQLIDDTVPEEQYDAPGTEANILCQLGNEFARANLKKLSKPFSEKFGYSTIREVVEGVQDIEVVILSNVRVDKNTGRSYLQVNELQVA